MRISLDHVHIFASDIDVTLAFFTDVLLARVVWDEEAAGARNVRLAIGGGFVHLYDQAPRHLGAGTVHHLGIETDDLDGLVRHMVQKGIRFRSPIKERPKFRYIMLAAPDNLLIELFQCLEPQRWEIGMKK